MKQNRKQSSVRIGLDISRDRNRELLTRLLSDCDVFELSGAVPAQTDLCLIDEPALGQSIERFRTWHTHQSPVFAPVVLLSETGASNPRHGIMETVQKHIDSVLQIPMPKAEIRAHIDSLLQMREFSQTLESEKRLTSLVFELSPLAKLVLKPDGTIVRANKRAGEIFHEDREDFVGQQYNSDNWTAMREDGSEIPVDELPFAQLLETGEAISQYQHLISRPRHDDLWVSVSMAPIWDELGKIAYVVVVIEDITAQHTQSVELERHVDLFQKAQEIASIGAWEYNIRTENYWVTQEVYRIHGLPEDADFSPERSIELYHPVDRPKIQAALKRAIETGESYDLELRLIREDGDQRWIHTRGEPQCEGDDVVRIRGTIQDITERKERESHSHRMTNAVEKAPIGIILSDPSQEDNPLIYANEAFSSLTGYTREEALGRNCRFLQGEETDEATVTTLRDAIDAVEPVSTIIKNYRADGTAFWNHLEIAPIRDDDGTLVNFIGFQQDVTHFVESQRQLEILDRYLRHNIRNKMNIVNGLAQLIGEQSHSPIRDHADSIEQTGLTLLSNMEKERKVTKLLRNDSKPTTTDLMAVLQSIVTTFAHQYSDADITLSGPESIAIETIPELSTAFEELIGNAIEHNDSPSPTVEITVNADVDTVTVNVADDGLGIPEMEVEVLRNADAETAIKHGQGIGLWLVYLIVNRAGGQLKFSEQESRGSVVTVELSRPNDDV